MKNLIRNIAFVLVVACAAIGCNPEVDYGDDDRTSVVTLSKRSVDVGWEEGSSVEVTVTVPRLGWSAESDASWLELSPASTTDVGSSTLKISVGENVSTEPRTAQVTITSGNVSQQLTVRQVGYGQTASDVNHPDGNANKWMFETLKEWYLWNGLLENVYPDYACNYNNFLENTLIPLRGNDLDGGVRDGARYLYSYVTRSKSPATRSSALLETKYPSYGFATLVPVSMEGNEVLLRVTSVNTESPAERAEIKRGEYICKVNNEPITRVNYAQMYDMLMYPESGSVNLTMMSSMEYNGEFYFSEDRRVTLSTANIGNNPIVAYNIIEHLDKKVGYVAYNSFVSGLTTNPSYYDSKLENIFFEFAEEGIDELVVDLRYNGGGLVSSAQRMCSMIAPKEKLGEVVAKFRYNDTKQQELGDDDKELKLLTELADCNVNMKRVYILATDQSASASEMVIVGLRGLNVDVTVIGQLTEGKNVGMRVMTKHVDGYDYVFAPITFQIYNAQDYSAYGSGIKADYKVDEWEDMRSDGWKPLGDPGEVMLQMALNLITGSATRSEGAASVAPAPMKRLPLHDKRKPYGAMCVGGELE